MSEYPPAKALFDVQRSQIEVGLRLLDYAEQIAALKAVLFSLNPRAQNLFEEQLQQVHSNNQAQREVFEKLLQITTPPSGQPN